MSVIRVGSTSTYADGWEAVFGGGRKAKKAAGRKAAPGKKAAAVKKGRPVKKKAAKPGRSRRG